MSGVNLRRVLGIVAVALAAGTLGGCVAYPGYYRPAYGYGYYPAFYAPRAVVGVRYW